MKHLLLVKDRCGQHKEKEVSRDNSYWTKLRGSLEAMGMQEEESKIADCRENTQPPTHISLRPNSAFPLDERKPCPKKSRSGDRLGEVRVIGMLECVRSAGLRRPAQVGLEDRDHGQWKDQALLAAWW
jgi:hypothetical protein